jgi:hypothetical protein
MSLWDAYGAPTFGLNDAKLATYVATGSYGTAVDVPSVQMMGVTLRVQAAEGEGDDHITVSASRVIGGRCRMRLLGIDFDLLEILFNITATESGSTPNRGNLLKIPTGVKLPYFGVCGKALAEEGSGDLHVFVPKAKIMSDITLAELQYGQFATNEFEVSFVDDDTYEALELIEHETSTAIAIPPVQ